MGAAFLHIPALCYLGYILDIRKDMDMDMKTCVAIKLSLVLFILLASSSVGAASDTPALDMGLLNGHSLLTKREPGLLPPVGEIASAFGLEHTEEAYDVNGLAVLVGGPEMKPCCIPGVNGATEHLARLFILQVQGAGTARFAGFEYAVNGYCTLTSLADDMAVIVTAAEGITGNGIDKADVYDAVLKVLAVAHYDWYSTGNKAVRMMAVEYEGGLGFSVISDPYNLSVRLLWPASLPGASCMSSTLSSYADTISLDPIGMETILGSSFNAIAMGRDSDEESIGHIEEPGST